MTSLQLAIHFINSSLIVTPYVTVTALSHTVEYRLTAVQLCAVTFRLFKLFDFPQTQQRSSCKVRQELNLKNNKFPCKVCTPKMASCKRTRIKNSQEFTHYL